MFWGKMNYACQAALEDMNEETWSRFVDAWPRPSGTREELRRRTSGERFWLLGGFDPIRFTYEEAVKLQDEFGVRIDVVQWMDSGLMVTKMQEKDQLPRHFTPTASDLVSGAVVQIAIPDLGLLQIGEVTWLDDACTQRVQEMLDEGWRILAICPPNAQRRPDYIFGRRKDR